MLAMTIAALGVSYLYQALSLTSFAEDRKRFFEACAAFLDEELQTYVVQAASGGGRLEAKFEERGVKVTCVISAEDSNEIEGLKKITVTFSGEGRKSLPVTRLVTYYTPHLRTTKK